MIEKQGLPWEITLLNLQDLLDSIDPIRKATGVRLQDQYNALIAGGHAFGTKYLLRVLHVLIRMYHRPVVAALRRYWEEARPDMVVSFIPNFNRAMAQSVRLALPGAPFVTVLTDLADYPPHFWIERESEFLICGTDTAVNQAYSMGHDRQNVFQTSGMILNPCFYEERSWNRAEERERLGLHPELPSAVVLFGGCGARVMRTIVEQLDRTKLDLQLILICGRNKVLADNLRRLRTRIPKYVEGFTLNVPYYMHLSDFFIGKTGPGSVSEAVAMHLPVIVECNASMLPQERYNADWISQNGVGMVLRSFREINSAVENILKPGALSSLRTNTELNNRAVFEIPGILGEILQRCSQAAECTTGRMQDEGHEPNTATSLNALQ